MVALELQAIVFAAGRGTRLPELTSDHPKCLLPVGPLPMLWYPLHLLQNHGFQDAIVIVLESQKSEIQQSIEKSPLKIKLDYVTIPNDKDFGTADSLRHIHDKIKTDFIVLSCDVITNVSLFPLINKFRQHNASVVALLFPGGLESGYKAPGPRSKHKPERDLIGIHPDSDRLLFVASTSDFEETMSLPGHLLRKYDKMNIFSRLVDSHIYVMKKWIIDLLKKKDQISTIKGELIPYIVKKQMMRSQQFAGNIAPDVGINMKPESEVGLNVKKENEIFDCIGMTYLERQIINSSLFNDSRSKDTYNSDTIRCYAINIPKNYFGMRTNTTLGYFFINQKILTIWKEIVGSNTIPLVSSNAIINCTQLKDIAAADNATLSEKTSLLLSTFSSYCTINPKVKVSNSIIMSNAVIEECCTIENSIICNRAVIKKGSKLKNCLIGPNYVVEEGTDKEMLHLTNVDEFMEVE